MGSRGSLSLREFTDEFFSQPPTEVGSPKSIRQQQSPPRRRGSGENLHNSFSVEERSSFQSPSQEMDYSPSQNSRRGWMGYLRRSFSDGGVDDLHPAASSSRRAISPSRSRNRRRSSLDGGTRRSIPAQKPYLKRSNSDGFFNVPLPFFSSPPSNDQDHNYERSNNDFYRPIPRRPIFGTNQEDYGEDGKVNKPLRSKSSSAPQRSRPRPTSSATGHSSRRSSLRPERRSSHTGGTEQDRVMHERQHSSRRHSSFTIGNAKTNREERPVPSRQDVVKRYPTASDVEKYLRHYADGLRLPRGFLTAILEAHKSIEARLWLLENSSSMKIHDSHRAKIDAKLEHIEMEDGHSRWTELSQTVDFHVKMAARCWIPTKFWLVNDPGPSVGPKRFGVAWGTLDGVQAERKAAHDIMDRIGLDSDRNNLTIPLRKIEKRIREEAPRLMAANKVVAVVLCTQGRQTDEYGNEGSAVMNEVVESLDSLSRLPVKIVIRLCTDDEKAMNFFNKIDGKLNSVDVLDDYWGEAMEVYLHNPWLTYGFGIHRLREAGLTSDLLDYLDEKAFSAHDIYKFCNEFFIGEKDIDLTHPHNSWDAFMKGLNQILKNEKLQWNPMKKKLTPWIDTRTLEALFGRSKEERQSNRQQPCPPRQKYAGSGGQQARRPDPPAKDIPTSIHDITLVQIIQRWSHRDHDCQMLNSLQDLLCTVPTIFPPSNTKVEPHVYFSKWKVFSKEAFIGRSGDELAELLKRAVRKTKFFLHPDKLPNDLTESQTLLFKAIWDVIQEQEKNTLHSKRRLAATDIVVKR